MNTKLEAKLKTLPRSAGVYFHKSATGEIIYVGKAAVLKNRVRQYFQSTRDMDIKTRALVAEISRGPDPGRQPHNYRSGYRYLHLQEQ